MMNGMYGMMGPMMAWMMIYGFLVSVLVLVVLGLLAVWLLQQIQRRPGGSATPGGRVYPPAERP